MLRATVIALPLLLAVPQSVPRVALQPIDRVPLVPGFWVDLLRGLE